MEVKGEYRPETFLPHSQSDGRSEVFTRVILCQDFRIYLDWLVCFENFNLPNPLSTRSGVIVGDTGDDRSGIGGYLRAISHQRHFFCFFFPIYRPR